MLVDQGPRTPEQPRAARLNCQSIQVAVAMHIAVAQWHTALVVLACSQFMSLKLGGPQSGRKKYGHLLAVGWRCPRYLSAHLRAEECSPGMTVYIFADFVPVTGRLAKWHRV